MSPFTKLFCRMALMLCGAAALTPAAFAQEAEQMPQADKTLSPYFFVKSDDPTVDALPLKATSAQVNIAGVIADVSVKQVYKNEGKAPLEAIYIFPGSTRAAVYAMKMTIGERTIVAKIEKREEARQQYEQAKQEGKSASLLEQQRPNVFQMNVANIMPGDEIVVEMSYTELLIPTDGMYDFTYPTVVGPRYSNMPAETAPASEKWVENPYLREGEAPAYTFGMSVNLSAGLPIQQATCPSHKVNINYESKSFASIKLDESEKTGGNRDFVLKYQLAGGRVESGLLLYKGDEENFFLLMAQPPKRVKPQAIPAREYIFIVDVSGSMRGFPLDVSKKLLSDLIGKLNPNEQFNVLLFSGDSAVLSENASLPATPENIQQALQFISNEQGGGGTEILPAMQRALALPRAEGMSRSIIIVTDGYVNVEPQVFDLIRSKLGDANLFAFGIGSSVNRFLIEGMARVGMGEPFVLLNPSEAPAQAEKFRQYIQSPVLTQVKLDAQGFEMYDIEPPSMPDVFAERPVMYFGKWRGEPNGTLTLSGIGGEGKYAQAFDVAEIAPRAENAALRLLWARHRIQMLGDYNALEPTDERVKAITDLGLKYSLLTQYTSFIAVDSEVRNKDGKSATVKQPLPLPQGVSDAAVGQSARGFTKGMMMNTLAPAPMMTREKKDVRGGFAVKEEMADDAEPETKAAPTVTEQDEALPTDSVEMTQDVSTKPVELSDVETRQTVGAKTFTLQDGVWVDRAYASQKHLIKIQRDSQAFRDLLAALPDLQAIFALGDRVLVALGGDCAVEIAPDGKTELTKDELAQLVQAFKQP